MSDIFISYKREEQDTARKLASALESEGWTVWWDPKLRAGEHFDDVIEKALNEAKCVIVMWSERSVQSRYVRDEATYALGRDKLVPVAIENVNLPFRFKGVHTLSLLGWDGSRDFSEFRKLIDDIAAILGPRPTAVAAAEEQRRLKVEAQYQAEKTIVREEEKQRAEQEARQKVERETQRRMEEVANRSSLRERDTQETRRDRFGHFTGPTKQTRYVLGAVVIIILISVITASIMKNKKEELPPTQTLTPAPSSPPAAGSSDFSSDKKAPDSPKSPVSERKELILLEENFTNNLRGWPVVDLNERWSKVENGVYIIKANEKGRSQSFFIDINLDATTNFIVTSTIKKTSGPNEYGYGIQWGSDGPQNHYLAEINGNGEFQYGKRVNGVFRPIISWTKTSAIKIGNASNAITVIKRNDKIEFQVNGQSIRSAYFEPFFGNKIGFVVNETIAVEVQNMKITSVL
jgi:TIR domain